MPRMWQVNKQLLVHIFFCKQTAQLSNLFTFLYHRPPPVDMGSPSPRLLPKCKSQCVGRDKNQLENEDAPYFQFPPTEKEFDNICATSETPTSSSK